MTTFRMREAAQLLGVSHDTLRRWADAGKLDLISDEAGRQAVDGKELARLSVEHAASLPQLTADLGSVESARNQFVGLVTQVLRDRVMAQVQMQSGPHRIVSLMSREAADELGLEPGVLAVASIKSTNVVIKVPDRS